MPPRAWEGGGDHIGVSVRVIPSVAFRKVRKRFMLCALVREIKLTRLKAMFRLCRPSDWTGFSKSDGSIASAGICHAAGIGGGLIIGMVFFRTSKSKLNKTNYRRCSLHQPYGADETVELHRRS